MLKVQYLVYYNLFNPIYTIYTLIIIKGRAPLYLYMLTLCNLEAVLLFLYRTLLIIYLFLIGSF
jgi:hypothetical protein